MRPDLRGKRVLVVGMARSGVAAAELARAEGARVTCTDRREDAPRVEGAEHVYGAHRREDFLGADLVVVSPGVPAAQPDVAAAVAAGVPVLGELAFAASFLEDTVLVAVSGTNGKSTTTHLLGQLLARTGRPTFTGGNLGTPLSTAVGGGYAYAAVEVSSYQMELPGTFHPRAAAILNLTPDHLERHGDLDTYGAHKVRLFAQMGPTDTSVVPADDARLNRLAARAPGRRLWIGAAPGVLVHRDRIELVEVTADDGQRHVLSLADFPLPGAHNRLNLATAALLCVAVGVRPDELRLDGLTGLPHRMEVAATKAGVRWIDDSKATNVEASLAAYEGFETPFVALLGGQSKQGSAWPLLGRPLRAARAVITFGAAGEEIATALDREGLLPRRVASLEDAVTLAASLAQPGDSVLLSPACASFDAFQNFEHRGRSFQALVGRLP